MRQAAIEIIEQLRAGGYTAYLAGGCVRDRLLGLEPKDYDVATDAPPQEVQKIFKRSRGVGESFGVVLVYHRKVAIEVATFRSEWGYHDGRRPDHVIFTDAEHDAQRRDFTINGLFEDPIENRVIDYVDGQADLQAGILRAIGEPEERFAEDYLRMLRAVRFASRFGFEVESSTARAIRNNARYLGQISRERIGQELRIMLSVESASLMQQLRLDGPTLNEDPRESQLNTLEKLDQIADYPTRLAALLIDRHDLNTALDKLPRWRKALNLSNDERDVVRRAIAAATRAKDWAQLDIPKRKRLLADRGWPRARLLLEAMEDASWFASLEADAAPLFEQGVAPPPLVTGDDLLAMGMTPGPNVGKLLYAAYDAQLAGELTDHAAAMAWVRSRLSR